MVYWKEKFCILPECCETCQDFTSCWWWSCSVIKKGKIHSCFCVIPFSGYYESDIRNESGDENRQGKYEDFVMKQDIDNQDEDVMEDYGQFMHKL